VLTIDLVAMGQILGAIATLAAIFTFLRAQKKTAQEEGAAMQQAKDMQDKLACHDGQIKVLEDSDQAKTVIIAEINMRLQHICKQLEDFGTRLEKFIDESHREHKGKE
jgi:hypothetical protein